VAEALERIGAGACDLVISDLGLPDGSGYELMSRLRADFGSVGIALTGYGTEEDIELSKKAGFVLHLVKPVRVSDLEAALARCAELGPARVPRPA
jgi:CheY-like chemotaxis protein